MSDDPVVDLYDEREAELRAGMRRLVAEDEVGALAAETRLAFEALLPEMPYREQRTHVMFDSTFSVFQWLALYRAARRRGLDAHAVGRAMLSGRFRALPSPMPAAALAVLRRDAEASQREAAENEFVFAFVEADDETDWGIDVQRCAVCHTYARHDAMDLVPYMCASDDAVSAAGGDALRRTGTIGLGAHRCDFRYKRGGEPQRLADRYPDRIRTGDA